MPITFVLSQSEGRELTFEGPRIVIGRGPGSDVRLPDPSVSHRHATVRAQGSDFVLLDESSTNGTWVGGVRLGSAAPRLLRNGDAIRVGKVWLEVRLGAAAPTGDLANATRDLAFALVAGAMQAMGDDVMPRVRVVEGRDVGEEQRLVDDGRSYVIGRGDDCDLVLADQDASRRHVLVTRRGATIYVQDLGSKNGADLGGERLVPGRDTVWRHHAMLKLSRTVLALDEPVSLALADLEERHDEPMSQEEQEHLDAARSAASSAAPSEPPPPASALPESRAAGVAPIVSMPDAPPLLTLPRKRRSALSPTDWAIVIAALVVLTTSLVGLYFLLRG